jgi:hypothetical protein
MAIARRDEGLETIMARVACVLVFVCSFAGMPAAAQDVSPAPAGSLFSEAGPKPCATCGQVQITGVTADPQAQSLVTPARKRPTPLLPMYVSFAVLQGYDYATTASALSSGAGREANPVMAPIVGNRAAFLAVKAGTAAGTMWIAERMWKKHPVGAILFMAALNGMTATVVTHNVRVR